LEAYYTGRGVWEKESKKKERGMAVIGANAKYKE